MQAECPFCHTVFRLTKTQLEIADGLVRCGVCHEVFNALEKDSPVPETQSSQTADHASVTLFETQSKLIPDDFRIPDVYQTGSKLKNMLWILAIVAGLIFLVMQYMWFNRDQLLSDESLKPWLMNICNVADCEQMAMRDISKIEMVTRNVYSHPNVNNALMVSVTMINHAKFAQPHPLLQIDFSDIRGNVVAARRFTPEEYFQIKKDNLRMLEPEQTVSFDLEIQDPGNQAMTYEFSFL